MDKIRRMQKMRRMQAQLQAVFKKSKQNTAFFVVSKQERVTEQYMIFWFEHFARFNFAHAVIDDNIIMSPLKNKVRLIVIA